MKLLNYYISLFALLICFLSLPYLTWAADKTYEEFQSDLRNEVPSASAQNSLTRREKDAHGVMELNASSSAIRRTIAPRQQMGRDEFDRYTHDPLPSLKVQISAAPNPGLLSRDLTVNFVITNVGTHDMVYISKSPGMNSFQLLAEDETGAPLPLPRAKRGIVEGDLVMSNLKPGESFSTRIALKSRAKIEKKGRYRLQGHYLYRNDLNVLSEPIWLTIQ